MCNPVSIYIVLVELIIPGRLEKLHSTTLMLKLTRCTLPNMAQHYSTVKIGVELLCVYNPNCFKYHLIPTILLTLQYLHSFSIHITLSVPSVYLHEPPCVFPMYMESYHTHKPLHLIEVKNFLQN